MTAVYLLRHPETTWNVAQRYQGRLESPVSAEGKRQALMVAATFAPPELDVVISSPLQRARHLSVALARATDASLEIDQRLTEMAQGPWEGMCLDQIRDTYRDLYDRWYTEPQAFTFPGGENLLEVQKRSLAVLEDAYRCWPEGNVAVVTHSVVIQVLVASALSLPLSSLHRLRVSNCSITTLCGSEAPGQLLSFNSTESLYGSAAASAAAQHCLSFEPRRIAS